MSMLYELRVKLPLNARTSSQGVFRDLQGKGIDTEIFDRLDALRLRCAELDRRGIKWEYGKRTKEALAR